MNFCLYPLPIWMHKQQERLVHIFAAQPVPKSAAGHGPKSLSREVGFQQGRKRHTDLLGFFIFPQERSFSIRISKSSQTISDAQTQLC